MTTTTPDDLRSYAPLLETIGADTQVPLVHCGDSIRYANLDIAASAPVLAVVRDRVEQALPWYSSVHRGAGYHSRVSTAAYESARQSVRSFVGGRDDDVVIFTRNTTDSLNLLAAAVPPAGRVLVLDIEHHANLLPWRTSEVTTLRAADTVAGTLRAVESALSAQSFALLSVTGVSNVTGESLPLAALSELAHHHGARLAVDGAQLVPHRRVDIRALGIDYLAFSGHKIYAPFGAGVLIGHRDWLDAARPHLAGGGAVRRVGLNTVDWAPSPQRHEAGTPNTVGVIALAAACEALGSLRPVGGPDALGEHECALQARLLAGLSAIKGVRIARVWSDSGEPAGIATFTVAGYPPSLVAAVLSCEYGIGVRDGKFCAHPLLARLGFPEGAVRASIGVTTSSDDIERLLHAVAELASTGPRWQYRTVDGGHEAVNDPRHYPAFLGGEALSKPGVFPAEPPCRAEGEQLRRELGLRRADKR